MTATDPDVLLDARLVAFFETRAELIASEAPSVDEIVSELGRRGHPRSGRRGSTGGWRSRHVSMSPTSGRATVLTSRYVVIALGAALLVIAVAVFVGTGGPRLTTTPGPSASAKPSASASSALAAPVGYQGSGVIEFTRHSAAGEDDLWLVDPSGANERLLVPGGCCGLFSPDGRLLAAAVPNGGLVERETGRLGVNIYNERGTVTGTIPGECGACGIAVLDSEPDAWSSDGRQVAIAISSDTDPSKDGMAIAGDPPRWVFGTDALGPGEAHRDLPIAFSPDGTMLLFMREDTTSGPTSLGSLFVLTIGDRSVVRLTPEGMTVSANGLIQGPASWSPDGSTIAFAAKSDDSGGASIYRTSPSKGAKLTAIVPDARGATSARYSPDGTWIAYDVPGTGPLHDVHIVHPDGTGDRNLTADFGPGACCGQWSPQGDALLVAATPSDDTHYDLFVVPLDGEIRQVTQSPNVYTGFLWGRSPR